MLSHYRKLNIKSKSLMKSNPGWLELAYIQLYILPQTVSNLACAGWVSSLKCNRNIYFWWARMKMFAALNAACLVRRMSSFSVSFMQSYNGIHVKVIWWAILKKNETIVSLQAHCFFSHAPDKHSCPLCVETGDSKIFHSRDQLTRLPGSQSHLRWVEAHSWWLSRISYFVFFRKILQTWIKMKRQIHKKVYKSLREAAWRGLYWMVFSLSSGRSDGWQEGFAHWGGRGWEEPQLQSSGSEVFAGDSGTG